MINLLKHRIKSGKTPEKGGGKSGYLFILTLALLTASCEKPEGPGGKASISGRVYAYDFDNTQRYLLSKGYSAGETVYISYGNNTTADGNVKTDPDGFFEFKFLNKGHYRIWVNSLDTSIKVKGNDTEPAVVKEVDLDKKESENVGEITINK